MTFPVGLPKLEWTSTRSVPVLLYNAGFTEAPEHPSLRPQLRIQCRKFGEIDKQYLSKSWQKSEGRFDLVLPTYAMPSRQGPRQGKNISDQLDQLLNTHFAKLLAELKVGQEDIASMITAEAIRHMEHVRNHNSLDLALWCSI